MARQRQMARQSWEGMHGEDAAGLQKMVEQEVRRNSPGMRPWRTSA